LKLAVTVVQLYSIYVLKLFVGPLLYCNCCVDAQFVFPQDLQEKFDALSEQCRKYRKQIRLLAKKLKEAGGKVKAVSCVTSSRLQKVAANRTVQAKLLQLIGTNKTLASSSVKCLSVSKNLQNTVNKSVA
jgi:hypothetical protein